MHQIKSGLTRLKNRISDKIADERDVLGYAGVSKSDLLDFIDQTYGLTSRLEQLRGKFALVALKRKIMPELDSCKVALDESTEDVSRIVRFDDFLNSLTKIHDEVYLAYVVYCSEGLKLEASVGVLLNEVADAKTKMSAMQPVVENLVKSVDDLANKNDQSDNLLMKQEKVLENAGLRLAEIEKAKTSALASAEVLTKYESDARSERESINALASKAVTTEKHIKRIFADVDSKAKLIEDTLISASMAATTNLQQQKDIQVTLQEASKYGMAASFKQRKDELRLPMMLWGGVFVLTIVALCYMTLTYIFPNIKQGELPSVGDVLVKLTLASPLIWLGWMAAKQYGYIDRIREDYSFKYASALAFEGYKKEAASVNPELLRDLLDVATRNLALNPLRIYMHDNNEASPVHDIVTKLLKKTGDRSTVKPDAQPAHSEIGK